MAAILVQPFHGFEQNLETTRSHGLEQKKIDPENEEFFPFGATSNATKDEFIKDHDETQKLNKRPPSARIISFIRQHGNYLTPTKQLEFTSILATIVRAMCISSTYYFLILTYIFLTIFLLSITIFSYAGLNTSKYNTDPTECGSYKIELPLVSNIEIDKCDLYISKLYNHKDALLLFVVIGCILYWLALLFYNFTLHPWIHQNYGFGYKSRTDLQRSSGFTYKLLVLGIVLISIPLTINISKEISLLGIIVGLITAFRQFRTVLGKVPILPKSGHIYAGLGAIIFIFTILILAYKFSWFLLEPLLNSVNIFITHIEEASKATLIKLTLAAIILSLVVPIVHGLFLKINRNALGRMYRDRLLETFLPNKDAVETNTWKIAEDSHNSKLQDLCKNYTGNNKENYELIKPYQIINANVVLNNDEQMPFRNRGGDSFTLSPLYIGSDSTEYLNTEHYMADSDNLYLGTAMAISGAAAHPNTAPGGDGLTRNFFISMLMTFFNLRLGFWGHNPGNIPKDYLRQRPNMFHPGIASLLGLGFSNMAAYLDLTDGGHFENLGIYELVRRRSDIIIASDATASSNFGFEDLGNAIERVRVDFGVKIDFNNEEYCLENLKPGSLKDSLENTGFALAKHGFAIAEIIYPEISRDNKSRIDTKEKTGILVYIKSTLIDQLPTDLYVYKSQHSDYPKQSTSDQFFDEKQFEAYRELGYAITKSALSNEDIKILLRINGLKV